jgi:hypothetical protein
MSEEDQKQYYRRISDQATLIQNIDKLRISQFNNTVSVTETYVNPPNSVYVTGLEISSADKKEVDGISVNKLYNFEKFIEEYNKLGPASLSLLNPYIEIYKIYEDGLENVIPFNNFFPKSALDAITSGKSDRGYQANIQSVKIASQGKDTATAFIYTVQMNFIFDSVQTLFNDNSRYIELFNPPKKLKYKRGDGDQKYYQIKLKFGWKIDPPEQILNNNLNPVSVKEFANSSGSEIFLNYIKHNIGINEDGSVTLMVEYVGSLEMEARNPNKFSVLSDESIENLKEIQEKIDLISESLKDKGLKHEPVYKDDGSIEKVKILDNDGKEIEKPRSEATELERLYADKKKNEGNNEKNFKEGIINNILKQFGSDLQQGLNYAGKFPVFLINENIYLQKRQLLESSGVGPLEASNKQQQIIKLENIESNTKLDTGFTFDKFSENIDTKNYLNKLEFPESATTIAGNLLGGEKVGLRSDQKYYRIPFFTFRNLLKSLQALYGKDNKESEFIILGTEIFISSFKTGELIDPKTLSENSEYKIMIDNGLSLGKGNVALIESKLKQINILDIPIALSTFKYWFNKNISSQNLTQMSLMTFLNLCINELLVACVNPVNNEYVPKQNITFKISMDKISIDKNSPLLAKIKDNQNSYKNISLGGGETLVSTEQTTKQSDIIKKNIILFYAAPKHNTRVSNIAKDIKDGIPHFFYGQNKGIVNKINFREENIPFFKEANIQSQVDRKPWRPGVFLRGKYNVTIETLGTVNFRVGSMIYVSPSFPGVLNTAEPIQYGIGGYFIIVSISTQIESGKYITTLEANWVATGTGEYTDLSHLPFKVVTLPKPLADIQAEQEAAKISTPQSMEKTESKNAESPSVRRGSI